MPLFIILLFDFNLLKNNFLNFFLFGLYFLEDFESISHDTFKCLFLGVYYFLVIN